ncbi:hypothetical protein K8374_08840 [Pseudomonas sp. p1(2021b)]|uniref:hypothetical protein n=1 Tax=Pseudomonas sp. p1(2021b) TaxID=2874628 RepID=UPI001CCE2EF6|nr:hypothetical protein [Pseudomonas sp. p1(2021b)]UBM27050.1 hypothetical protein K8374_08840 [Pseudomonas sp. p1(2021b)]
MNQSIDLEAAKAAFFASGGIAIELDGYQYVPHRPHRDNVVIRAAPPKPVNMKAVKREKQLAELRELAKTMTYAQAAAHTGLSKMTLYRAAQDGGFAFQPDPRRGRGEKNRVYADPAADKELAAQIAELRDAGLNRHEAKKKLGISDRKFCRVIHLFGVDYPKAQGRRCDGPI